MAEEKEGMVVLGGPSPKKQRGGGGVSSEGSSLSGEGSSTEKWKVGALAAASKAPTFGKTTFAAAAMAGGSGGGGGSGDNVPAWLSKKPSHPESKSTGDGAAAPSFFSSATKKVGTSSWLSGPSSAGASSTLGTAGSGVGATTKPPAWLQASSLGSGSTTSSLGSTAPTTAPPAWLASSTGSAVASASSGSASSSSAAPSAGLFSAASKGGGASWLKPSGSGGSESTGSLTAGAALADTAASAAPQDKAEGDSPAQDDEQSSSPTKRRKYEEVGIRTGEESESCLQKVERVRLYHFRDGNWSERARECTLHLNETQGNGSGSAYRARIVIRTKETKSLVFNASLWPTMESQKHGASEKVTRICCYNVAETDGSGAVLGTYLISPSDKADGTRLRAGIEQAKLKCPAPKAGDAPAPNAASGSNSSDGQEKAADTGTMTKLPTEQDAATSATAGSGAADSKETEAPAKKLKMAADTVEPAASAASTAATPAPHETDATAAANSSTARPEPAKDAAQQPPPQEEQQQEEEEEDPDADL